MQLFREVPFQHMKEWDIVSFPTYLVSMKNWQKKLVARNLANEVLKTVN